MLKFFSLKGEERGWEVARTLGLPLAVPAEVSMAEMGQEQGSEAPVPMQDEPINQKPSIAKQSKKV